MYKRVLVPLDGSTTAEKALPHAVALAELYGAKLVLLRILEPFPFVRTMTPASIKKFKLQATEWALEYFERITTDIAKKDISFETVIVDGRAGMMITKYAEVNQIDLIILCSRGLTGITRWLMGSVADRVLRGTNIPILMIPAKNEEVLTA